MGKGKRKQGQEKNQQNREFKEQEREIRNKGQESFKEEVLTVSDSAKKSESSQIMVHYHRTRRADCHQLAMGMLGNFFKKFL